MKFRRILSPALPVLASLLLLSGGCSASEAQRSAEEGAKLYDAGDYDAALPLLEKAVQGDFEDGELFYQLGYIYDLKSEAAKSRQFREKSLPLLEKKARSRQSTLETWYYLTALYANLGRLEEMKKTAQEAVGKYGEAPGLSAGDLFRLGRLYQFAGEGSKGGAAYHRAVEAFEKERNPNATLLSLALLADARTDFQAHRFAEASGKFQEVARLSPRNAPSLTETALAHLGAGDYDQARSDFEKIRDPDQITEAQYGSDLARHLREAGGRLDRTPEGKPLMEIDNAALEEAIRSAAGALRKAREEQSGGKGSPESMQGSERLFFSLVAEWMLRKNPIREAALSGGYADLIRR